MSIFRMLKYFGDIGENKGFEDERKFERWEIEFLLFSPNKCRRPPARTKLRNNRLNATLHPISFGFDQIKKYVFWRPLPFQVISESIHFTQSQIQGLNWTYFEFTFVQSECYRNHSSSGCIAWKRSKNHNAEKLHNFKWSDLYFGRCSTRYINTTLGWLDRGG